MPSRIAGWAGAEPLADGLLAGLAGRGVEVAVVRRGRAPLSTVLVHPDGERTLLTDRGEGGLAPADVRAEWSTGAAVVHLTATTCCAPPTRCGPLPPRPTTPGCR